jgi:hypothetical protein
MLSKGVEMEMQAINQLEVLVWQRAQIRRLVQIIVQVLNKGVEVVMQAKNQLEVLVQ